MLVGTVLVVSLPTVALAVTPTRPLTARLSQEYVKKLDLEIGMYSANVSEYQDGDIDRIELEWDTDNSFDNPDSSVQVLSSIDSAGNLDTDNREMAVSITGMKSAMGYYVRARFLAPDDSASDWKESSEMVTLPKKAWNTRVPKSTKVSGESVRLRWNHPQRCLALGCDYNVKVYKVKKNGAQRLQLTTLVRNANYLDLTDTSLKAGTRYKFKVQSCLDSNTCSVKYTKKKGFRF